MALALLGPTALLHIAKLRLKLGSTLVWAFPELFQRLFTASVEASSWTRLGWGMTSGSFNFFLPSQETEQMVKKMEALKDEEHCVDPDIFQEFVTEARLVSQAFPSYKFTMYF